MKIKKINYISEKISNFIFKLRNKDYVRKNSLNNSKISLKNHKIWIKNFLDKKNIIYIIKENELLIGYIRLELSKKIYNVSWAMMKKFHGKGYTKKALNYATKNKSFKYKAFIKRNNLPSLKVAFYSKFKIKRNVGDIIYLYKN